MMRLLITAALLGIACSGSPTARAVQEPGHAKAQAAPSPEPHVDYEAAFLKLAVPEPPPLPAVP
jgi:hypothetical protein